MPSPKLVDLARDNDIEALEQLWEQHLTEPQDAREYRKTAEVLCGNDMASRALAMVGTMVDALAEAERKADAAGLAMTMVGRDVHNDALARRAFELLQELHGSQPWFEVVRELASLDPDSITGRSLVDFERMRSYTVGNVLYHRAGWGEGLVEEFRADAREVVVRFTSGMVKELPLSTALDSMTPLETDDLRCMLLTQKEELERLAQEDPSILVRKATKVYRGEATSAQVKSMLSPAVVPTKKWATFWKKAKAAAAIDPWLQVEGSTSRPVFVLRKKPLSLGDEARRSVVTCDDLGQEVALLRDYIDRSADEDAVRGIVDIVAERIEAALAGSSGASHAHILDGMLLLEEHGRELPTSAASELRKMVYENEKFEPLNFDLLATQDAREHAVRLIPDALGEDWAETCVQHMTEIPPSVVEKVVDLVNEGGGAEQLLGLWRRVAPYPRRHPFMTYLLGRLYADGAFAGNETAPSQIAIARVVLHLARVLSADRRGDTQKARLLTRVVSLLTGRRNFLKGVLDEIDREDLAVYLGITERGGEDFPQEITTLVLRAVADKAPELTAKPEKPFWEQDVLLTTAEGLAAKREEYRQLIDVKIPENSRAIGVAASHGDLSENSEWDAAMEEQRNLTTRASEMQAELEKTRLIEECEVPDDIVAPGTRVTWETGSGQATSIRLLGPWDSDDDVINYRAPIADNLLGRRIGDSTSIHGDKGEIEIRITGIEKLF